MPRSYYRCSICHSKVTFEIFIDNTGDIVAKCPKCGVVIRCYRCQHNYWWELLYMKVRDIIRRIK